MYQLWLTHSLKNKKLQLRNGIAIRLQCRGSNAIIVPFLACGDLSGYDEEGSETSSQRDGNEILISEKALETVQ